MEAIRREFSILYGYNTGPSRNCATTPVTSLTADEALRDEPDKGIEGIIKIIAESCGASHYSYFAKIENQISILSENEIHRKRSIRQFCTLLKGDNCEYSWRLNQVFNARYINLISIQVETRVLTCLFKGIKKRKKNNSSKMLLVLCSPLPPYPLTREACWRAFKGSMRQTMPQSNLATVPSATISFKLVPASPSWRWSEFGLWVCVSTSNQRPHGKRTLVCHKKKKREKNVTSG